MGSTPIFKQRRQTILLGLTGRTGSGCSYIASLLTRPLEQIPTDFSMVEDGKRTKIWRQKRIISQFIEHCWMPFCVIKASDFIFYFILKLDFDNFVETLFNKEQFPQEKGKVADPEKKFEEFKNRFEKVREIFEKHSKDVLAAESYFSHEEGATSERIPQAWRELNFRSLAVFREELSRELGSTDYEHYILDNLQDFGNNIRQYGSIKPILGEEKNNNFSSLSEKIDDFISLYLDNHKESQTRIVIDSLRSPADIIYFREKYAFFYLMSVSADERVRTSNLFKADFTKSKIQAIDRLEDKPQGVFNEFAKIHISRCLEMADIHLVNYGDQPEEQKKIGGQLLRYISLILHPGLVQPTPHERIMQIALTAKLNSGCLSRQVGAAVTNEYFSVMSIGWNEVPEGQIPCSMRYLSDLFDNNDLKAFSKFEQSESFRNLVRPVYDEYRRNMMPDSIGIHLTYCFKDIFTTGTKKQKYNQVHTRTLHAEENSFLQLAKFGNGQSVKGGKLFTTASCCVLCAKKAYQLGIKEIFYIDAYPDISQSHILESGYGEIEMKLFEGVVGRAYLKLYDQFLPIKDELELHYGVEVKRIVPDPEKQESRSEVVDNAIKDIPGENK